MRAVIFWFKRDLRIADNIPLLNAINSGFHIIPLFIIEPDLWQQKELSLRQYKFQTDCLNDIKAQLNKIGGTLNIKTGEVVKVFETLNKKYEVQAIYSHQETWNYWTFQRDIEVRKWTKRKQIPWIETVQNGVVRRLKNRDKWGANWSNTMTKKIAVPPLKIKSFNLLSDDIPKPEHLDLVSDRSKSIQKGGRAEALKLISSFLRVRGEYYQSEMSSPLTAIDSCSRLSAHLAFGTISIKEVYQRAELAKRNLGKDQKKWKNSLKSFLSRLRWHCHFIQKLEDEPSLEFKPMNIMYEGLRQNFNPAYLNAWNKGETGYPMVDACMRCLISTGWLNFRMRAMLVSFACNNLWIDWKIVAENLGPLFVDYEPGIHYPQVQMQAGITGINTVRIYNPIKQGLDHDPNGLFIKRWVPELKSTHKAIIHTPWLDQNNKYIIPIVDEAISRKAAADKIYEVRRRKDHREHSGRVLKKHGSRKRKSIQNNKIINNQLNLL